MSVAPIQSKFTLTKDPLSAEQIRRCLTDFSYYSSHATQIIDKHREYVYMKENPMQKQFFEEFLPLIDPETRPKTHVDVVWIKPRQGGGTVGLVQTEKYMSAYVPGLTHMTILHILQSGGAARKLYNKKVKKIIEGTRPQLMPIIYERDISPQGATMYYEQFRGRERDNTVEYLSSGSSSIRSDTVHVAIYDEYDSYRNPEELEDAVQGAMPKNDWSLSIYISTISERGQLIEKAKIARDNPDVMKFIFTPWFYIDDYEDNDTSYYNLKDLHFTEQELFICHEMKKHGVPANKWLKKLSFYRKELLRLGNSLERMRREYPTSEDEVFQTVSNNLVFDKAKLEAMKDNLTTDITDATIFKDTLTDEIRYSMTKMQSPFHIKTPPVRDSQYWVTIDPINSMGAQSDFMALLVTDRKTLEDVAWFRTRNMSDDEIADWVKNICTLYNHAMIVIENNIGKALTRAIRQKGYRRFWYKPGAKSDVDEPGITTTGGAKGTKLAMARDLQYLIDNDLYTISDPVALEEFLHFEKEVSKSADYTKMHATGKDIDGHPYHDDDVLVRMLMTQAIPRSWYNRKEDGSDNDNVYIIAG